MARDLVAETTGIKSGCIRCLRIVQICKERGLGVHVPYVLEVAFADESDYPERRIIAGVNSSAGMWAQ